jgi:CheY-like chemotaxis protein
MACILIIEDEREIRANVRRFLALEGHEVLEAEDGIQGLEIARTRGVALVLCDVMMPRLDGFAVLRALRAEPATARLPFVFITASAERDAAERALQEGADNYIVKPFDLRTLGKTIGRHLGSSGG